MMSFLNMLSYKNRFGSYFGLNLYFKDDVFFIIFNDFIFKEKTWYVVLYNGRRST